MLRVREALKLHRLRKVAYNFHTFLLGRGAYCILMSETLLINRTAHMVIGYDLKCNVQYS